LSNQSKTPGSLALLRQSGSTARVLNLVTVRERFRDDPSWSAHPLFVCKRLNESIILKHSPRSDERDLFPVGTSSVTKIIIPFSVDDVKLGGMSTFVESKNFRVQIQEVMGYDQSDERYQRDISILEEIARLPSLDPYLLREKINRMNLNVARIYFNITEADMLRMREHVTAEIQQLVSLAFAASSANTNAMSQRLAGLLLEDETSEALKPLRATLRLSASEYREGMFGWKGFLYYKWRAVDLQKSLNPLAKEILTIKIKGATTEDTMFLNGVRERIVHRLGVAAGEVRAALKLYDQAFQTLVSEGQPNQFRSFLLSAPSMFVATGEYLAALEHIASFWRFRFNKPGERSIGVEEAYDLFQQFESSLGGIEGANQRAA
jgi:hypothetical protein